MVAGRMWSAGGDMNESDLLNALVVVAIIAALMLLADQSKKAFDRWRGTGK